MIHFDLQDEPDAFDERCRQRGHAWLIEHPKPATKKTGETWRPHDYWSEFRPDLSDAFGELCSIGAMYEPAGTVDHFVSCDADETQAYEWANYRFVSGWLNSSKNNRDGFLDPFDVQDGWFEVSLPDLQLKLTENIPPEFRATAQRTLENLPIRDDERIMRQRQKWYNMYQSEEITLQGLRNNAPLIARAVEKAESGVHHE